MIMFLRALRKHFFVSKHKNAIILTVDSSRRDLNFAARLVIDAGYNVLKANDGKEAFFLARIHKPNLIIFDLNLNDMSGLEFYRNLKRDPDTKDIPVIVLTKNNTSQFIFDAYESGIDNYLIKPFTKKALLRLVNEVLQDAYRTNVSYS